MSAKGESSCTERGVDPKELLAAINMVMRNSKVLCTYKTSSKPVGESTLMAEMLAAE